MLILLYIKATIALGIGFCEPIGPLVERKICLKKNYADPD